MTLHVSVCIPASRPGCIGEAVASVVAQRYRDWDLIVVAQGPQSAEIEREVLSALGDRKGRVIRQDGSGASRARNAAAWAASGEIVAFMDDDCEALPDWLEALVARFEMEPKAGIVSGAVIRPPKRRRGPATCPDCHPDECFYQPRSFSDPPPEGLKIIGANLAFYRSVFDLVGPFDRHLGPGTSLPVFEEIDWLLRARRFGIAVRTTPDAIVVHRSGWRYGLRAVLAIHRNYARGVGGGVAKLVLAGELMGLEALREHRRSALFGWLQRGRHLVALPMGLRGCYHLRAGYRECMGAFIVDERSLLAEKIHQDGSSSTRAQPGQGRPSRG